jgi:hypothetical protein
MAANRYEDRDIQKRKAAKYNPNTTGIRIKICSIEHMRT